MYNTKRAANCLQKVVIFLSLKEGIVTEKPHQGSVNKVLYCIVLYAYMYQNCTRLWTTHICFCIDNQISVSRMSGRGSWISVISFSFSSIRKFCRSQIFARKI